MKKLSAAKNKDIYQFGRVNLAHKLLLGFAILSYSELATAAELKYRGNAQSSIDAIAGKEKRELDSDRLSLEYTETSAPIIVADAEAKAATFLPDTANSSNREDIIARMTAIGKYAAHIDYGWLRGISQTQIETSSVQSAKSPVLSGKASAIQNLSWSDKLKVISSTLPQGKTVRLKMTLNFTRYLSKEGLGEAKAVAVFGIFEGDSRKNTEISISGDRFKNTETTTQSQILEVKVGQTLDSFGSLELLAKVSHPNSQKSPAIASAIASAQNSAKFYIDPVDSDISYTTESGREYFSNPSNQNRDDKKVNKILN